MVHGLKTVLLSGAVLLLLGFSGSAVAQEKGAVGVRAATHKADRLAAQLREARHVEDATRRFTSSYGGSVGRWVWLARDVGWKWSEMSTLMAIVYRESRGDPRATNVSSGAAGLLQFMPQWYQGPWHTPFDPYDPRANLDVGEEVNDKEGWSPWSL